MAQVPPSSYDERLLKDAPAATKEQIQEGYNPDLLAPSPRSKSLHRSQQPAPIDAASPVPVPLRTDSDVERGQSISHNGSQAYSPTKPSPSGNFWRSTRGMIVIAVLAIVIIAAIIGGAVGGTVHKSKPKTAAESNTNSGQGTGSNGSGGGISVGNAGGSSSSSSSSTVPLAGFTPAILRSSTAALAQPTDTTGVGVNSERQNIGQQQIEPDQAPEQERRDLG